MSIALQRRLRCQVAPASFFCPFCAGTMDPFGDHALVCPCRGDRTKRHNLLRNLTFFALGAAGLNPDLERPGLLPPRMELEGPHEHDQFAGSGLRRPADVFVPRWRDGFPAALDFAVTSGLRTDVVERVANSGSVAVQEYEERKRSHLNTANLCANEGFSFIPLVVEAHGGGWGLEARRAFSNLALRASAASGNSSSEVSDKLTQRLSCLLHRENARAVLLRLPGWTASHDAASLEAASALSAG